MFIQPHYSLLTPHYSLLMDSLSIQERTEKFAVRVIKAYCVLNKRSVDDAGKVLSKQFLRSLVVQKTF